MAQLHNRFSRAFILASVAAIALIPQAANAQGERTRLSIPSQPLGDALSEFARQSRQSLLFTPDVVRGRQAPALNGDYTPQEALNVLLGGAGRTVRQTPNGAFLISAAEAPPARRIQIAQQSAVAPAAMMVQAAADLPPAQSALDEVVVTGSRIRSNGNDLPTPVTIVSAAQLQQTTPSNIPDALNKLPSFNSQSTPNNATTGANGRGFNTPGNFLNMRNLGAIRTLILEDGRRVPGTFFDTTVDTDMLPQC
jgi:iron complex outermembrane receptor protein